MAEDELDAETVAAALRTDDTSPLHVQVEQGLRHLIKSGRVPPGAGLPGELDLAATLGLSRHTIRHALMTLAGEGLVQRERGRGTHVVAPNIPLRVRHLDHFYAFAWEISAEGRQQRSRVLETVTRKAPADIAQHLMLSPDATVKRIARVRMADDEPLVIETAYIPSEYAAALDSEVLERASVYDEIERRFGQRVTRAQEIIRPMVLSRSAAELLHVRTGSPAFRVERTAWASVKPIEWKESIVRGDRFLYSVELGRAANEAYGESA